MVFSAIECPPKIVTSFKSPLNKILSHFFFHFITFIVQKSFKSRFFSKHLFWKMFRFLRQVKQGQIDSTIVGVGAANWCLTFSASRARRGCQGLPGRRRGSNWVTRQADLKDPWMHCRANEAWGTCLVLSRPWRLVRLPPPLQRERGGEDLRSLGMRGLVFIPGAFVCRRASSTTTWGSRWKCRRRMAWRWSATWPMSCTKWWTARCSRFW